MKNQLYFSKLLTTLPQYQNDWRKIKSVLDAYKIDYHFLDGTRDIWARDYMPILNGKGQLIQCKYEPSYLNDDLLKRTNPEEVKYKDNSLTNTFLTINLDGGNFVKRGNKVIISDRIFSENNIAQEEVVTDETQREKQLRKIFNAPFSTEENQFIKTLESHLDLEVIIVPSYSQEIDLTGHSDGYVRFIHDNVVLVSDLANEEKLFADNMLEAFKRHDLEYYEIPSDYYAPSGFPYSAMGCYVNYLELENLIIFPIFDRSPHIDNEALKIISRHFPHKKIEPIIINDIAKQGGLMNCVSWQG